MRSRIATLALALVAFAATGPAVSQQMLAPPDSHYLLSKGAWGQSFPDQWALGHIGFDASPQSAWRLIKRDAAPVIVAVIDTGLDWTHRNVDWENLWFNPNEIPDNGIDDDRNGLCRRYDRLGLPREQQEAVGFRRPRHHGRGPDRRKLEGQGRDRRHQPVRAADDPQGGQQFRP
jgi:hypothetical protein